MAAFRGMGFDYGARDRVLQRFVERRPPESEDDEANIRWGGKSTWQFHGTKKQPTVMTMTVNLPDPETPEEVPPEIVVDFLEVTREVTEVRVENPDDAEQYVIVEDTTVIVFEGPDLRPNHLIGDEGRQEKIYYRYTFLPREDGEAV